MRETAPNQVQCRLIVEGKVIAFTMDGPLVALRPERKSVKKGRK